MTTSSEKPTPTEILVYMGDGGPYPPQINPEDVEPLRKWISAHTTSVCFFGIHERCAGVCALGSKVVEERPCLCMCHLGKYSVRPRVATATLSTCTTCDGSGCEMNCGWCEYANAGPDSHKVCISCKGTGVTA